MNEQTVFALRKESEKQDVLCQSRISSYPISHSCTQAQYSILHSTFLTCEFTLSIPLGKLHLYNHDTTKAK